MGGRQRGLEGERKREDKERRKSQDKERGSPSAIGRTSGSSRVGERKGPSEGLNLQREVEKEELITERGLYREGRGFRVERGEGLRAKATERQVGEQLGGEREGTEKGARD